MAGERHPGGGRGGGRLHGRHGAAPARPRALPRVLPRRAQGAGARHHLLDALALLALDRVAVPRPVPPARYD